MTRNYPDLGDLQISGPNPFPGQVSIGRPSRDPPRFLARTPHGDHDTALIRRELEDAGFSRVTIETSAEQSHAFSPRLAAVAYCQGTTLRGEIEARDAGILDAATDCAASAIADEHGNGKVAAKIQAHVITAMVWTWSLRR